MWSDEPGNRRHRHSRSVPCKKWAEGPAGVEEVGWGCERVGWEDDVGDRVDGLVATEVDSGDASEFRFLMCD